jgi:hypothetical protein
MRYLLVVIGLTLGGCDVHGLNAAQDPVTRCIAFGHDVSECVELAKAIHQAESLCNCECEQ